MDTTTSGSEAIDDYIAHFPYEVQEKLQELRVTIREAAPEATEKISYQMPTYDLHGNLVHFAAFKKHIGFYPGSAGTGMFSDELTGYKWAKGSVQFPLDKPIPLDLVRKIVAFRVAENTDKAAEKKTKRKK